MRSSTNTDPYAWSAFQTLTSAASSSVITGWPTNQGTHLELEGVVRTDSVGQTFNSASLSINGDGTAGHYRWQKSGASGGSASGGQSNDTNVLIVTTADSVASYMTPVKVTFRFFRDTSFAREWVVQNLSNSAATSKVINENYMTRLTPGAGQAITDPITDVTVATIAGGGKLVSGTKFRWRIQP